MKVKQSDLKVGDVVIMSKFSAITCVIVTKLHPSGSFNYLCQEDPEKGVQRDFYDFTTDIEKLTKKGYAAKSWSPRADKYLWLIHREET